MKKIEVHPFKAFVPPRPRCLILGSFPGRAQTATSQSSDAWFYGSPRNQFWKIMELVYGRPLANRKEKEKLFAAAGIAITDLVRTCIRAEENNRDENLQVLEYNTAEVAAILEAHEPLVLCTSLFVARIFRKLFPAYGRVEVLPSPSPRYFRISLEQKAVIYRQLLPRPED